MASFSVLKVLCLSAITTISILSTADAMKLTVDAKPDFAVLKPHRAVYEVKLDKASQRSGISAMDGRIVYELTGGACEGIAVNYRFVARFSANGDSYVSDLQTATHEAPEGDVFTFHSKSFVNDRLERVVKGVARKKADTLTISLDKPQTRELSLSEASFVSAHLIEVIKQAKKGTTFFQLPIFDGGDDADEVLKTTNVVGRSVRYEKPFAGEKSEAIASLAQLEAWPVTVGYFSTKDGSNSTTGALPIYEVSFSLYENGISRNLHMRYPDYALSAQLIGLEMLEEADCSADQ